MEGVDDKFQQIHINQGGANEKSFLIDKKVFSSHTYKILENVNFVTCLMLNLHFGKQKVSISTKVGKSQPFVNQGKELKKLKICPHNF